MQYYPFIIRSALILSVCIALIPGSLPAFAQTDIQWSQQIYLHGKHKIPQIAGFDETGYYMLAQDYTWAVEKLDADMQYDGIEYLTLHKGLRTFELLALVHFHDSLYLFTTEIKMRSKILYVETIDKETLKQNEDRRKIIEVLNMGGWMADFRVKLSKLEKKLLVSDRIVVYRSKTEEVHFMVFGEGMEMEWEARETSSYLRNWLRWFVMPHSVPWERRPPIRY